MNFKEFNQLDCNERLLLVRDYGKKIDNIFPRFGNIRIVTIYELKSFFIEVVCDLKTEELTNVFAFDSFDYLKNTRITLM
jgi:hypothetical protein